MQIKINFIAYSVKNFFRIYRIFRFEVARSYFDPNPFFSVIYNSTTGAIECSMHYAVHRAET